MGPKDLGVRGVSEQSVSIGKLIMDLTDEEVDRLLAELLNRTVTKLLREKRFETR